LSVSAIPNHFFNAEFLHRNLAKKTLPERDASWTPMLKYAMDEEYPAGRLISWAWNNEDKSYISDDSVLLACITLGWLHTSTTRALRDGATKAMICLLKNRIPVLIQLLKKFENVNDPYVYERLFAVSYGVTLLSDKLDDLGELSEYIAKTIFIDLEEVYPHILLRDYARGVIEFTSFQGVELSFQLDAVRPPYNSSFPEEFLTIKAVDELYKIDNTSPDFQDHHWAQNSILNSMTTEYGRGGGYGDFGRYTFESDLREWNVNTDQLSNLAIEWIFEKYGYDVSIHGHYDRDLHSDGRGGNRIERIGKKYQWMALHEILARVSDNFDKYDRRYSEYAEKKAYQGTWDPFVRDIDPTILMKNKVGYDDENPEDHWWSSTPDIDWDTENKSWVFDESDIPKMDGLLEVTDEAGDHWYVLDGSPEWAEPKKIGEDKWDYPRKRMSLSIYTVLVKNNEASQFNAWLKKFGFINTHFPDVQNRYEVFNREFYWSAAYQYFQTEYYNGAKWNEVHDRDSGKLIASIMYPINEYSWEAEFDNSKEESLNFSKPSEDLFYSLNLKYGEREGEFVDANGKLICFSTNVHHNSRSFFLIRKEAFNQYLSENDLSLFWIILGDKQMIGGRSYADDYVGRLEIYGGYSCDNGIISGALQNIKT
jgi:hypothetical protein